MHTKYATKTVKQECVIGRVWLLANEITTMWALNWDLRERFAPRKHKMQQCTQIIKTVFGEGVNIV